MTSFYQHWSDAPAEAWRWPHFAPREIASKGDGSLLADPDALDRLEALRQAVGEPIRLLSAYRDPIHNALVGGAPRSLHKLGRAFDIPAPPRLRGLLLAAARQAGFAGLGFYQTFLHVDTGPARSWFGGGLSKEAWSGLV